MCNPLEFFRFITFSLLCKLEFPCKDAVVSNCLLLEDMILEDHTVSGHPHQLMQFKGRKKAKRPLNIVNTAWFCLLVTPLQAVEKETRKQFVYYKQVSPPGDSWNHAVGEDNHGTEMVGNFICST